MVGRERLLGEDIEAELDFALASHAHEGGFVDHGAAADVDEEACAARKQRQLRRVQEAALAGHRSLGVEIYSRVDVLLDAAGNPFVLEANTIPGMTETSLLPKSAAAHGIGFTELCLKIAELSLALRSR
jgi:D-alanine-D-alanine ligase